MNPIQELSNTLKTIANENLKIFERDITLKRLEQTQRKLATIASKETKSLVPSEQQIIEAVKRLRHRENLTRKQWRIVFENLANKLQEEAPLLIEDPDYYPFIRQKIQSLLNAQKLTRREWISLSTSYFSYYPSESSLQNWLTLRKQLKLGLYQLVNASPLTRKILLPYTQYADLFEDNAGEKIALELIHFNEKHFLYFKEQTNIPHDSWLWDKIYKQLSKLFMDKNKVPDNQLPQKVDWLLNFLNVWQYHDKIYKLCLTRYYDSSFRYKPHNRLKKEVLLRWGNPQISTEKRKWDAYLGKDITKMFLSWMAKEDLTVFFELISSRYGVDRARLFYWLRFANQITYSKFFIGPDVKDACRYDQNFKSFYTENKSRLSLLTKGGSAENNAIVLKIDDVYIVEFSKTGNACYIYNEDNLPFSLSSSTEDLDSLKNRGWCTSWLRHAPTAYPSSDPNHINGWMQSFERELNDVHGIYYIPED